MGQLVQLVVWTCLTLLICQAGVSRAQDNSTTSATFDFSCARGADLCGAGTCDVTSQQCVCPTDGNTYNFECTASTAPNYCESPGVYGDNCNIPRLQVNCDTGKMFVNVLPYGGTANFGGMIYIKGQESVDACKFVQGTTQVYTDKAAEFTDIADYADSMEGFYLELPNTGSPCGDATVTDVAATADDPKQTIYSWQFYVQYNPVYTSSVDQMVTAGCREIEGATTVYVGMISNADDTGFNQVNVQNDIGVVTLEMLDSNFDPITTAIPLGTEIILRFNLGTGNDYTALWLSGCSANNSLAEDDPEFQKIDIVDENGCPASGAVGVFKNFPSKPTPAAGEPQVILMSIGAFRFMGSSDNVAFQCEMNLCKAGDEGNCEEPQSCTGFTSTDLELPPTEETNNTQPTNNNQTATPDALTVTLASDTLNPLDLADNVTLTCTGQGGTAPLQYSIRLQTSTDAPTFADENTLALPTGTAGTVAYVCEVQDADGATTTSDPVSLQYVDTLTVEISRSPEGDVKINTDVEINCKAAGGSGQYTYVVQRNSVEASITVPFTVNSATVVNNGYKCVVTDTGPAGGTDESSEITISFINPLEVVVSSSPANPVPQDTDAVVSYTATGGTATYTVAWLRDDVLDAAATGETYTVAYEAGASVKVTAQVTDSATPAAVVSEDVTVVFAGSAVAPASVSATLVSDQRNPVDLNGNVVLTCTAAGGTEPYTYEIVETATSTTVSATATYDATSATAQTRTFLCRVTDADGATAESSVVSVTSVDTLTATAYAEPAGTVALNTIVTFFCKAAGSANPLTYSWTKGTTVDFNTQQQFDDTSDVAATNTYTCTVTDTVTSATATSDPSVSVVFAAPDTPTARRRRSASLIRLRRDTSDSDRVSGVVRVFDPRASNTDGNVQKTEEDDCVDQADVVVIVIILSIFVVLLLVLSAILGVLLMRSRQKVGGLSHGSRDFESPVQTMTMPRLEISSSRGSSSVGSHGV